MQISPGTSLGVSCRPESSTYSCWLASGPPYGIERQPGSICCTWYQHDQIDASVAPPSVKTSTCAPSSSRSWVGTHSGQKSPESITRRSGSAAKRASAAPSARRLSRSATITGGAVFHTVTWVGLGLALG